MMRLLRTLLPLGALLLLPLAALAGEETTTWRQGDPIIYTVACHDAEGVRAIYDAEDPHAAFEAQGANCFRSHRPIPAKLEAWISGGHAGKAGRFCSIWRALDITGDREFVCVADDGGPHAAVKELAL